MTLRSMSNQASLPLRRLIVDTRGEFVLPPTEAMWEAMRSAEIGWPLWREDPYVNRLEEMAADLTGKEAAMLVSTTSVANLLGMMGYCQRGDQVIMEARCHLWWVEDRNIAAHTGAVPRLIRGNKLGEMALEDIESAIEEQAYAYRPRTAMVCLENTHNISGGVALSPGYTARVGELAHRHEAAVFVDGARLFNAAVAHDVPLRAMTEGIDAVSLSLNKGLGAPYGAMLCGSKEFIQHSRQNHRVLGCHSVHKEGLFAAAAIVALETMVDRLAEDHRRARMLAERLAELPGLRVDMETVQTNIVRVEIDNTDPFSFVQRALESGVGVTVLDQQSVKFVVHHGIDDEDVETASEIVGRVVSSVAHPGLPDR